jgi:hypothetical protein
VAVRLWKENEFKCYGLGPEKANSKTIATQSELVREERKRREEKKKVRYKREASEKVGLCALNPRGLARGLPGPDCNMQLQ